MNQIDKLLADLEITAQAKEALVSADPWIGDESQMAAIALHRLVCRRILEGNPIAGISLNHSWAMLLRSFGVKDPEKYLQ